MEALFLTVLGMSGTASLVILAVLLVRLALRKAPKAFSYALWAVVLFRLLCPLTIESAFSLLPAAQVADVPGLGDAPAQVIQVQTGVPTVDRQVNDFFLRHPYQGLPDLPEYAELPPQEPSPPIQQAGSTSDWRTAPSVVWLAGAALLLGYSLLSLLGLRRKLVGAMPLAGEKNIRLADHIPSPFVLGLVRPKIYLPSGLSEGERDYILLHERTHIRRLDHVTRALAWLALAVHWFNPLVWLAFHLAGKDMEMSCDEAVLRRMGRDVRADYSTSLLRLSVGGMLPAGPLAFGSGDTQGRIKNVLHYKKPALWVVVIALAGVLCAGVALATNPAPGPEDELLFSYSNDGDYVAVDGSRAEEMMWFNGGVSEFSPLGMLSFSGLTLDNGWEVFGSAGWTGEDRSAMYMELMSSENAVTLTYTVLTSGPNDPEQAVIEHKALGDEANDPHLSKEEVVELALHFAQCLRGAEEFYANARPDGLAADLTLSLDGDGTFVRIGGVVDGIALEHTIWDSPEDLKKYVSDYAAQYPLGKLSFELPLCDGEVVCSLDACWTDESRSAVRVTATPRAMVSSYSQAGNLIFTVSLKDGGTLLELDGYIPKLSPNAPELVPTQEEAVWAALVAAKLLTAAEDFYANARSSAPLDFTPAYSAASGNGSGDVRITGMGNGVMEWSFNTSPSKGSVYFTTDPAFFCPRLTGKAVEGSFMWGDENRRTVSLVMNVNDPRVSSGTVNGFYVHFVVDVEESAVVKKNFGSLVEGETLELTDQEMVSAAQVFAELLKGAEDYYNGMERPSFPASSLRLNPSYALNDTGNGVAVGGLNCPAAVWYPRGLSENLDPKLGLPEDGALGYLTIESPRFLGGYFAGCYGNALVLYYPEEPAPLLFMGFDDYTRDVSQPGSVNFTVNLVSGEFKCDISGYGHQAPEFTDAELADMARALAQVIQGAAGSWGELSNPPPEEGPLPFDAPMRLWFGSGAGAWRTILTLHPDGSFEGKYDDANMGSGTGDAPYGNTYICTFHGKFGDIRQVSAASWSMTLEELALDTGRPVGEEWIEERRLYISSAPYGLDGEDGQALKPGTQFMLYTPEAKGYAPGDELYGMNGDDSSSELYEFWTWWPDHHGWGPYGSTLGCYALRNVETGYGFFDLRAWGIT